jgi:hypothetical protein
LPLLAFHLLVADVQLGVGCGGPHHGFDHGAAEISLGYDAIGDMAIEGVDRHSASD